MVQRILRLINKEFGSVGQAALLLGIFQLLSQILGLLRDRSLAHFLGAGENLDIYYASFRIPDFLFVSVASLFAVTALLPSLAAKIGKDENGNPRETSPEAQKFFSAVFTVFLGLMVAVSIVAFFLMPVLAPWIAPGLDAAALQKMILLSRIMLLSPILLGLSNLLGSVTQYFRKFFVFALSPLFYNLGIIVGVIFFYPMFGLAGLAYGVVLGALLHFIIQWPVISKHQFWLKFSFRIDWREIKELMSFSLPRTIGLALNSITLLVLISLATLIEKGSVSIFTFAFNLGSVPIAIIGTSYAIAAFPTLAHFFSTNEFKKFMEHVGVAARQIIFWSLPISFLFIILRAQIVRVILGSGNFSWSDTRLTAAMLAVFSISVVAQGLNTLLVRAYYAAGETRRPLLVNLFSAVAIIGMAQGFLYLFKVLPEFKSFFEIILRVENLPGTSLIAIVLAFSIGIILNFFLLWRFFRLDFREHIPAKFLSTTFFQSLTASFALGVVSYFGLIFFANILNLDKFSGIFFQGFFAGILGIVAWFTVLRALKSQELNEFLATIKSKFWKTKIMAAPQEKL